MVEINKRRKVLLCGGVCCMVGCWRNGLVLVRRCYRIWKECRICLRKVEDSSRDINGVNELELGEGVKFIMIELCLEK